jgi:hypothetical protein
VATDFDPAEFVTRIGEKLVMEFAHASVAGTPGLIGAARENPARKQLEKLLPAFVSTGSGIVMDSFGARSSQQDIVFFERDFCPVYSINDTPEATYFPVEGVVAVGEVKSTVDKATLFDALDKIKSAKMLKRFSERSQKSVAGPAADYRTFGLGGHYAAIPSNEYDQEKNYRDQVYGFLICKSFRYSGNAVLGNLCEYVATNGASHLPNIIVSLDDGFIQGVSLPAMALQHSPLLGNGIAFVPDQRAFAFLVHALRQHAREGRTIPLHTLDRYMVSITGKLPDCEYQPFPPTT